MTRLSFEIEIAAPVDRVAAFFVPQRMAYWYGAEMEACLTILGGAADFAVGQKVRLEGRAGKHAVTLAAVVTEFRWGQLLEWRFEDAYGVRGMQRWEIEPAGERARVQMRDEYDLRGRFGRFFDWLVTRHAVARRDRGDLERLRRLAERR